MQSVIPVVFVAVILVGCGGGGGSSSSNPGGGNPAGGGGTGGGGNNGNPTPVPPMVVSAAPQGDAVSVDAAVEITFSKPMKLSSFLTALDGLGVGYEAICVDTDCKTIRFTQQPQTDLAYNVTYTLTLSTQVVDKEGNPIPSSYQWSFTTAPFVPPPSFITGIAIDGLNGEDSGECTALAIDSSGTIHIVYYSESDGSPKHAFCPSSVDCSVPGSWTVGFIENPDPNQKRGRDINLAIEGETLHVTYRDVDPPAVGVLGDDKGVLKYVKGEKNLNGTWDWSSPVIVDDTEYGVTDTYIAVNAGSVHISYRKKGATSPLDTLAYATCSAPCDSPSSWDKVEIDHGNDAGTPSHIVVTNSAIHISYYLSGKLTYVTCNTLSGCDPLGDVQTNWERVFVDDGGVDHFDVGTENSLAVDGNVIHITYRDNSNSLLKYARCDNSCTASPDNWQKVAIDAAGGSSQIKVDGGALHVSYRDDANKDLKYARCFSNCLSPESWSIQTIDAPGEVGLDTYLEVKSGVVHISYRDAGNKDLKYTRGSSVP